MFRPGEGHEGGDGVTVVAFRPERVRRTMKRQRRRSSSGRRRCERFIGRLGRGRYLRASCPRGRLPAAVSPPLGSEDPSCGRCEPGAAHRLGGARRRPLLPAASRARRSSLLRRQRAKPIEARMRRSPAGAPPPRPLLGGVTRRVVDFFARPSSRAGALQRRAEGLAPADYRGCCVVPGLRLRARRRRLLASFASSPRGRSSRDRHSRRAPRGAPPAPPPPRSAAPRSRAAAARD